MKKLLVIGGSGLVGSTLIKYAYPNFKIFSTYGENKILSENCEWFNIHLLKKRDAIIDLINKIKPDAIIHTAAHASVDLCETDNKIADELHVEVTKDIAEISKNIEAKLLYLSTDWVFEGQLNKKYIESDLPNPVNYYGKTKLQSEKIILDASTRNVILRTAVIYGWHKKSRFTNWILTYLFDKKTVDPFSDQYATPTLVDDLAQAVIKIIERDVCGLYHATGKTCLNRFEFALKLAEKFNLEKSLINPVTKLEKKQDAPRPVSTCLDSRKLEALLGFDFKNIENGINFLYESYKKDPSLLNS